MGANAQTTVPTFTAGDVLTAAQMNESARTGVPVFADTTARDAAFGGTGEKTLAEGQLCYLENLNIVQYYDGAAWATVGPDAPGMALVKTQTIGTAVSTVAVTDVFSSTYDNYKILISGGAGSTGAQLTMVLGATTTGYYYGANGYNYSNSAAGVGAANQAAFAYMGYFSADGIYSDIMVLGPNLAKQTVVTAQWAENKTNGASFSMSGYLANTTQYTGFTIGVSSGTLTGGTIKIYGYKN